MPAYKVDMQTLPEPQEVEAMLMAARRPVERALIIFLYLTGARPAEAVEMQKADFNIQETEVSISIPTKKLRDTGKWTEHKRTLTFDRNVLTGRPNHLLEELIAFVQMSIQDNPNGPLWHMRRWNVHCIVNKLSLKALKRRSCPYLFRHNALSEQSRRGASIDELMQFKGSNDVRSVSPYIHSRPHKVRQEIAVTTG